MKETGSKEKKVLGMRWRGWAAVTAGTGGLLLLALVVEQGPWWKFFTDRARVQQMVAECGVWAPLAIVALHMAQVVLAPIPGQVIDAVSGYLFGPWWGTLYSVAGVGLGSALAMGLARRWGRPLVARLVSADTLARLDGLSRRRGAAFFFLVFLLPFLPDDAACLLAGLSPLPLGELLLLCVVGRLPGLAVANWVGATAARLSPMQMALFLGGVLLVGGIFWRWQERIEAAVGRLVARLG